MKYTIILILNFILLVPALAQEVDLTKAYLITPEPIETDEAETSSLILQIGGIKITEVHEDKVTERDWKLLLDFGSSGDCIFKSQENTSSPVFRLLEPIFQNRLDDPQLLQQQLSGTVWKGEYITSKNVYDTELRLKVVQAGFVGGEIIHTVREEPDPSSFLHATVAGDIVTQFLINDSVDDDKIDNFIDKQAVDEEEIDKIWVSVNGYEEIIEEIREANEDKEEEFIQNPQIVRTRQLLRLKRNRNIGDSQKTSERWGSYHEYRLVLESSKLLIGSAGTPPKNFGSKDALTGIGDIELEMFNPMESDESGSE